MKRIVLITTSFPRVLAGSESAGSFVEDFSAALSRHCELAVIAPGFSAEQEAGDGYSIHRYAAPERALSQLRIWAPRDALAIWAVMRDAGAVAAKVVDTMKPDFVLALWALPSGYWARAAVRRADIPYGLWCLGSDIWSMGRIPVIRSVLRSVLRSASHVFADGYELGAQVNSLADVHCEFLASSRRLPVVDSSTPPRAAPPYRLLFIGRWHPNKGTDLMLDALALLDDADWALIEDVRVYGGGPLEEKLRIQATALQAAGRPVHLFGYIDKKAAAQALHDADWLLIPSRIESIPVVFSDAMQARRPVVSMPVGDLPALVDKFHVGVLAEAVSATGFAAALKRALHQSAAGYLDGLLKAAETFEVDAAVRKLLQSIDL